MQGLANTPDSFTYPGCYTACVRKNHHPIYWEETVMLDHGRVLELLVKEALRGALQPRWRTGNPSNFY